MPHLVEILLPLTESGGDLAGLRRELADRFGGVTAYTQAPAEGVWRPEDGREERDRIVVFEVMTDTLDRPWWASYRTELEKRFEQEEIVIRSSPIERL